jgi:hypothetical protein
MVELCQNEMQEITGGDAWGCAAVGFGLIAVALSGPISWAAYGLLAASGIAGAASAC